MEKTILENGITVLVDHDPRFTSTTLSICLLGGLSDEAENEVGVTHLLEHLLFKRTKNRSSKELSCRMDELGGEVNAFTDFDSLCVYGTTPGNQFTELADLLREILLEHEFAKEELEVEKEIIRQEILEASDSPADVTYQCLNRTLWPTSIFRFPVFGTLESVVSLDLPQLYQRRETIVSGKRCIVACCGATPFEEVVAFSKTAFSGLSPGNDYRLPDVLPGSGIAYQAHESTQVHLSLALPWIPGNSEEVAGGLILSTILGGGLSSRLFYRLREEEGLAYEVSTNIEMVGHHAHLIISSIMERQNLEAALAIIEEERVALALGKFEEEEIQRAQKLLRARFHLDLDSPQSRLWYAIDHEIRCRTFVDKTHPEAVLAGLDALTPSQVKMLAKSWLSNKATTAVFGGDVDGLTLSL